MWGLRTNRELIHTTAHPSVLVLQAKRITGFWQLVATVNSFSKHLHSCLSLTDISVDPSSLMYFTDGLQCCLQIPVLYTLPRCIRDRLKGSPDHAALSKDKTFLK